MSARLEPILDEDLIKNHLTEECVCPPEYKGLSCESCSFSHFKTTNSVLHSSFQCLPCPCHFHSDCNPENGACEVGTAIM